MRMIVAMMKILDMDDSIDRACCGVWSVEVSCLVIWEY